MTESRRRWPSLLFVRHRTSGTENENAVTAATGRSGGFVDDLMCTREVLVGHKQVLILAGRIGRDRAEAEVVEALDQGTLILLLRRGGRASVDVAVGCRRADWTKITGASATGALGTCSSAGGAVYRAASTGASTIHAAAVELMASQGCRVEVR